MLSNQKMTKAPTFVGAFVEEVWWPPTCKIGTTY